VATTGDIEARNHLIVSLARNVGKIAGLMVTRRFPLLNGDGWLEAVHEIIGCGNLGLVDAPSKITLSRGNRLSTVVNQWARKYAHDGLASLVSVIYYPERKRNLAQFDSQLAAKSPGEDEDFEAFDSFGDPTNPELKLGYLQRQVGKRLYPWHDWGTYKLDARCGDPWTDTIDPRADGRFDVQGGVSSDVQDSSHHERPSLLDWPIPRDDSYWRIVPATRTTAKRAEWIFLNEWARSLFEGQPHFGTRDAGTTPVEIHWERNLVAIPKRWLCHARINSWSCTWSRPVYGGVRIWNGKSFITIEPGFAWLALSASQGSYSSLQRYAKPKQIAPEVVRLVENVCANRVRENGWRDVPERRQLDAYCHWDKYGNRIDKPTWLRQHVRVDGVEGRFRLYEDEKIYGGKVYANDRYALAPKGTCLAPVDWLANTADGLPPTNWNTDRHWRTTYPGAVEYLRRANERRLRRRAHRMFNEVKRAAEMFNGKEVCHENEILRRADAVQGAKRVRRRRGRDIATAHDVPVSVLSPSVN
jgi:hypothetical protein